MHATRAAAEEGIVPGGGVAYVRSLKALEALNLDGEQAFGVEIVRKAIVQPLWKIATNAGHKRRGDQQDQRRHRHVRLHARTEVYEDLEKAGVIDPAKVSRSALQNAE